MILHFLSIAKTSPFVTSFFEINNFSHLNLLEELKIYKEYT